MFITSVNKRRIGNTYVNTYYTNTIRPFTRMKYFPFISWIFWSCIGGITLLFIAISFLQMYRSITTSNFFSVERINIHGTNFFSKSAILNETDLHLGINSFSINIGKIEKTLLRSPWVERVSVKRRLPGIIDIFITERKPMFWILRDGLMHYVDSTGRIIALVEKDNFVSLPTIEIFDNGELLLPIVEGVLKTLQATSPIEVNSISAIKLSKSRGIEIFIEEYNTLLCIGSNDWQGNLKRLCAVLSDLVQRGDLKKVSQIITSAEGVCVMQ